MTRIIFLLMIWSAVIFLAQCVSERVQTERDLQRLMPPVPSDYSSADSAKLVEVWASGMKMYKSNCAECHGIFGKGKESMPNFSEEELHMYKTAFLAGDTTNHSVMKKMTEQELNIVLTFLLDKNMKK